MWEQWLRRAHDGGLQLMVMHAVNNVHLCSVVTKAPNRTCDDREAIQYQIDGARAMQAYIDNQSGGPGRGWYRIVYSPAEARQAIAAGQLAVVLGVEVDHPFPTANPGEALAQLNAYYQLGIRHLFPVHFEDNEVGGSAYDKLVLDRDVATVPPGGVVPKPWSPTMALGAGTVADVLPLYYFSVRNCGPPYRIDGGRCNARGLAPGVGTAVIRGLMNKGMLIDIDHMSELTFFGTMDLLDAQHYPAVSGHTGFVDLAAPGPGGDSKAHEGSMTLDKLRRVQRSGGMVALIASQGSVSSIATFRGGPVVVEHACGSTSETVAQAYLYAATYAPGMAVGIGTDMNGFLAMPGGRFGPAACGGKAPPNPNPHPIGVQYPFTAIATGRSLGISRAVEGDPQVTRTFDFNSEGLAHIGLLPDLIEDLRKLGIPDATLQPMLSSAEGYLRAWESALANRLPDESPLCGKARSQGLAPPTGCWY
jgi:microsomal dipeptidase-like Zn-dependent dipeptidase